MQYIKFISLLNRKSPQPAVRRSEEEQLLPDSSVARSKKSKSPMQALKFARNSQIGVLKIARKIAKFTAGILPPMSKYCDILLP